MKITTNDLKMKPGMGPPSNTLVTRRSMAGGGGACPCVQDTLGDHSVDEFFISGEHQTVVFCPFSFNSD